MRIAISIVVWLAVLFSGGCAVFEKEMTNRGGFLDAVLDDHWMKADSKRMRALRAYAMQVSLTRVASVVAKNDSDRQLLAIRIGALTERFIPVYRCAFNVNPLNVPGAENDPCFYFDSAMVDYSTGLFDLAMIALPIEDAKKLVTTVTGSFINPINIVDLLGTLLQIGKDAIRYGRVVGALYRDTVELEVQVWLATPAIDRRPFAVTPEAVRPLSDIYLRGNDDLQAWIAAMAALRAQGLEPLPQVKFFLQLNVLMNYICTLVTQEPRSLAACQIPLPVVGGSAPIGLDNVFTVPGRRTTPFVVVTPSPGRQGSGTGSSVTVKDKDAPVVVKRTDAPVQKSSIEIMSDLLKSGNADTQKATRARLQGFLADESVKSVLPPSLPPNVTIERIATSPGPEFDVVRGRIIALENKPR